MTETKHDLIKSLISDGYLKTPEIIAAFEKIDRADFVRESEKKLAYANSALPIGYSQTVSQPLVVAFMIELLSPKKGEKILDIGSGSGWTTALIAEILSGEKNKGRVMGMELVLALADFGRENIKKYGFVKNKIAEIICANASMGYEKEAPFDKILCSAACKKIPVEWKKQLKIGGVIVSAVNQSVVKIEKKSASQFVKNEYFGFSFVPFVAPHP